MSFVMRVLSPHVCLFDRCIAFSSVYYVSCVSSLQKHTYARRSGIFTAAAAHPNPGQLMSIPLYPTHNLRDIVALDGNRAACAECDPLCSLWSNTRTLIRLASPVSITTPGIGESKVLNEDS
ncbi:hypothetical protein F5B19DRAFT_450703 [Rostrohypoxylon terebratum]|nr:hypothetical protein F5B19DRAFT_450703 [Rostrohypoxylon terebratum]